MPRKKYTHTKNGLIQNSTSINGFIFTVNIAIGVDGESACLIIRDCNVYGDERDERQKEQCIPINYVQDFDKLSGIIEKSLIKRTKTIIS